MKPLEDLIGIDKNNLIYFTQNELPIDIFTNNNKRLYVYDRSFKLRKNLLIKYPLTTKYASDIFLSGEGKIFYYYIEDGEIQFVTLI